MRQSKYLNIVGGIETVHMIKKGQLHCLGDQAASAASQICSLAA
jgi:hypothetical protein